MSVEEYYTAPPEHVFDDIKRNAIAIWQTYDNQFGYVDEKVGAIEGIGNIKDNAWYMVAMFDLDNQAKLLELVTPETAEYIRRARGY